MTKKIALPLLALLAIAGTALAATAVRTTTKPYVQYRVSGDSPVAGGDRAGLVRATYTLPSKWKRTSGTRTRTLRFATGNSCRHTVTITARLAADAPGTTAAERAARQAPGSGNYVYVSGTRNSAVFRVVRTRGTANLVGVLEQRVDSLPDGRPVFSELRARATNHAAECHSGGPRTVGDALADAFGAGSAGGFVP